MSPAESPPGDLERSAAFHGRPTVVELVEAVREFLDGEVMTATTGRTQFHTRVAIRVLDTVARELSHGSTEADAHAETLRRLGHHSDHDLVEALRTGRYDDRLLDLADELEPGVRAKVEVANPGYLHA